MAVRPARRRASPGPKTRAATAGRSTLPPGRRTPGPRRRPTARATEGRSRAAWARASASARSAPRSANSRATRDFPAAGSPVTPRTTVRRSPRRRGVREAGARGAGARGGCPMEIPVIPAGEGKECPGARTAAGTSMIGGIPGGGKGDRGPEAVSAGRRGGGAPPASRFSVDHRHHPPRIRPFGRSGAREGQPSPGDGDTSVTRS